MVNSLIFTFYIIILFISLNGYGLLFNKIYKLSHTNNNKELFGENCFFSIIILIPISILINFFFPINYFTSIIIFGFGIIAFFSQINLLKNKANLSYILLFFLLVSPYFILVTHHDDFYYYHLPYLNILEYSKIIFGLANLNTVLVYPQNLWFNVFALFRLPLVDYNGIQALNGIFTIAFILFCFEVFLNSDLKKIKIISLTFIVFVFSIFSRLKDHGAEIIPQLIMLMIFLYSFIVLFDEKINKKKTLVKISIILTISLLLRLSSVIIIPFLILIFVINFNIIIQIVKKIKFTSLIILIVLLVLTKNVINSGCLIYPLSVSCFSQNKISWSIDKEIPKINENVILSYTRGWMIYAKENIKDSSKFVFNPKENILTHSEYLSNGIKFWIKYWIKDPDIKRLLNILYIGSFILLILLINNLKKFNVENLSKNLKLNISTIIFLLGPIIFWLFLSTPSSRYGGYSIFIALISFVIGSITEILFGKKILIRNSFIFIISLSFLFFSFKNLQRVNLDLLPWPKKIVLEDGVDFKNIEINQIKINLRIPTNKLLMGNLNEENNYILHCGNIKNLCTPIKKINCIQNIEKKFNYYLIYSNKDKCVKLHSKHALY